MNRFLLSGVATLSLATTNLLGVSDMVEDMAPPSAGTMMQVSSDAQAFDLPDRGGMAMAIDVAQTQEALEVDAPKEDAPADRTYDAAQLGAELDKKNGGSGPLAPQMAQGTPTAPGSKLVPVTKNKKRAQEVMKNIFPGAPKPAPEIPEVMCPPTDPADENKDVIEEGQF